jgi:hypothetical protein
LLIHTYVFLTVHTGKSSRKKAVLIQKKSPDFSRGVIIRFLPEGTGFIINPPGVFRGAADFVGGVPLGFTMRDSVAKDTWH